MMDEESKISYNDLAELMKHNILPKEEIVERQYKVFYYIILGILTLSISGIICWYIYK
jgi:cytochrome b subunit of formate dehydrogenase